MIGKARIIDNAKKNNEKARKKLDSSRSRCRSLKIGNEKW